MLPVVLRYRWRHLNPPWTAANLIWHAVRDVSASAPAVQESLVYSIRLWMHHTG